MYTIYALVDPRDYTVHYVGQTADVYQRFIQHISGDSRSFTKNVWLFELRALGFMVIMETLEIVGTYREAIEREAYWIKHFEVLKEPLSNVTHRAAVKRAKKDQMKAARHAASQVLTAIKTDQGAEASRHASEKRAEEMHVRKASIRSSLAALKSEGKALTLHAIAKKAGLTRHQYDDIEEVAIEYGYELDRGRGRPAKEG